MNSHFWTKNVLIVFEILKYLKPEMKTFLWSFANVDALGKLSAESTVSNILATALSSSSSADSSPSADSLTSADSRSSKGSSRVGIPPETFTLVNSSLGFNSYKQTKQY